ncbi:unnamed protein product [Discosporangium mesarthrocarpum]
MNKSKRLGRTHGREEAIMKHKWYGGFDWEGLMKTVLDPPFVPEIGSSEDVSNFNPNAINMVDTETEACPEWVADF